MGRKLLIGKGISRVNNCSNIQGIMWIEPPEGCMIASQPPAVLRGRVEFHIEVEREEDGRWLADVPELSGVMAYGKTQEEAKANAEALALRVIADKIQQQKKAESVAFAGA
jgi:predicted RNase H-like HicB family nuclease